MAKVLCVLYDDPVTGYPKSYARDAIPKLEHYPGGQTVPSPKQIDFTPGALLGSVSGGLGLRKFLEGLGHTFVVTSDKEGENSVFERELPDADIVISQPFWPAYLTAQRIAKAKKLKLAITAGIGSDHVAPSSRHRARSHGRRSDLQQQHQRLRACGDDDLVARAELHSLLQVGRRRRLERRRLCVPVVRSRSDGGRNGRRRPHRHSGSEAAEAVRCQAALHRSAPASGTSREGARRHLPSTSSQWFGSATWSPSMRLCIPKPNTSLMTR